MSNSELDGPTKFPCAEMEKLRDDYLDNLGALRRDYVEAAAKINATWFLENYEDPVESTPCDGGEYVYIWGECDTRDVIENALYPIVPEDLLEEVVETTVNGLASEDHDGPAYGAMCGDICVPLFGRHDPDDDHNEPPDDYNEPPDDHNEIHE